MSDVLVRNFPDKLKRELQKKAKAENLSLNQFILRLLDLALEHEENEKKEQKKRDQVFEDVRVIRERLQAKYGKFDDSTKLIREDRDSR